MNKHPLCLRQILTIVALFPLLLLNSFTHADSAIDGYNTGGIPDPFEPLNRQFFEFNEVVDEHVAIPVAETWQKLPSPIRTGVNNFFNNLDNVVVIVNDLLQLKFEQSASDTGRLVTNTTFGVLGFFDVASEWGMPKHEERFADTLGYWGVGPGAYLVIPLLGPSSIRDGLAIVGDIQVYPLGYYYPVAHRNTLQVLKMVNARANLLSTTNLTKQMAIDPYTFSRDSYHQFRQNRVYDGNPPVERLDESEIEDIE